MFSIEHSRKWRTCTYTNVLAVLSIPPSLFLPLPTLFLPVSSPVWMPTICLGPGVYLEDQIFNDVTISVCTKLQTNKDKRQNNKALLQCNHLIVEPTSVLLLLLLLKHRKKNDYFMLNYMKSKNNSILKRASYHLLGAVCHFIYIHNLS